MDALFVPLSLVAGGLLAVQAGANTQLSKATGSPFTATTIQVLIAGLLLALPVAALLSHQVGVLFLETPLTFTFSFLGTAIWFVLAAVLSAAASLVPAWNATRLSVRDVLSYE